MESQDDEKPSYETLERIVCAIPCIVALACAAMILLHIKDLENITGGPEAYENSQDYKMAAWILVVMSIVGLLVHHVLRAVRDRHFMSFMNDDVTFGYTKAVATIIIAVLLFVGGVANVMCALENTRIMEVVMAMMQTDHSMFTTSDDEELYEALRRIRTAEVVTAIFSFLGVLVFTSVAVMTITCIWFKSKKQNGNNCRELFNRCYHLIANHVKQFKQATH